MTTGPGRPRKQQSSRPGATAIDEILDAAAELFTTQGFANTSTRAIADAVGVRQSSLYHHFKTKDDILEVLLSGTVAGGLAFAREITGDRPPRQKPLDAAARLHATALYDGTQLCTARWNLGVLYHLPEARSERFSSFLEDRRELRSLYQRLGAELPGSRASDGAHNGDLAFRLVESLVSLRADGLSSPDSPMQVADAGIVLCGLGDRLKEIRAESRALIAAHGTVPADAVPCAHTAR